jgi:hypothetical protein
MRTSRLNPIVNLKSGGGKGQDDFLLHLGRGGTMRLPRWELQRLPNGSEVKPIPARKAKTSGVARGRAAVSMLLTYARRLGVTMAERVLASGPVRNYKGGRLLRKLQSTQLTPSIKQT